MKFRPFLDINLITLLPVYSILLAMLNVKCRIDVKRHELIILQGIQLGDYRLWRHGLLHLHLQRPHPRDL
jgi:hypothetical protein